MTELFVVCATYEIDDCSARGFVLARVGEDGATKPWSIMITRKGNNYFGFENACPHEGTRLDSNFPGEFMDEEGNFVVCGRHGAQFDLDTGHCFSGPCQGKALTPVPLVIDDGDVCLSGIELADEDGLDIEDPGAVPEVLITGD